MTALLQVLPCLGCTRKVVQGEDGVWRHPGGKIWHSGGGEPTHAADPDLSARKPSPEVARVGIRAMVDLGWSCWSSERKDHREQALGGVIVSIDDMPPDTETGEVVRIYTCVDVYTAGCKVHRLTESEIETSGFEAPTDSRMRQTIARLLRSALADFVTKDGRTKALTPAIADRIRWAARLVGVVLGAGR